MDKPPDDMPMPAGFRHKVKRLQKECCTRTSHGKEGGMERYEQTTLFPKEKPADVMPSSTSWNLWHGCHKCSPGCWHCYVYRRDAEFGRDSSVVNKTKVFRKPVQKYRTGPRKGEYKYPSGTTFLTCFTSDFFIAEADEWRPEAWAIMRERSDCYFYMITKRPERILDTLPADWGKGYPNVHICCTCENQKMADKRLPIYLELPLPDKSIIHEPMLEQINIRPESVITAGYSIPICSASSTAYPSAFIRPAPDCGREKRSTKFPENTSMSRLIRHIWISTACRCRSGITCQNNESAEALTSADSHLFAEYTFESLIVFDLPVHMKNSIKL